MTDEHLVLLLDEESDRIRARVQSDFQTMVEAVRVGTIFGTSTDGNKQHAKWLRSTGVKHPSLSGAALEQAVLNIARLFPENVLRGTV